MENSLRRVVRLAEGQASDDGAKVRFRIETQDGPASDFEVLYEDLPALMRYFALVAEAASKARTAGLPPSFAESDGPKGEPLPATRLGLLPAEQPGKALLVVRNYDFDLQFLVDNQEIRRLLRHGAAIAGD